MKPELTAGSRPKSPVQNVAHELKQLLAERAGSRPGLEQLADAQLLLESLPLATDEFAVARQRLKNASRYLRSNERGAARYELRLLEGLIARYGA